MCVRHILLLTFFDILQIIEQKDEVKMYSLRHQVLDHPHYDPWRVVKPTCKGCPLWYSERHKSDC